VTESKIMTKMVKDVKLCVNFTRSQMTTVIWHAASSASPVAVVLGLHWAARHAAMPPGTLSQHRCEPCHIPFLVSNRHKLK